jgi:hypothetical protein
MSVRELREKLSRFDEGTQVVVYAEEEPKGQFFEINDISIETGTPMRAEGGNAAFRFEKGGPASWVFISVSRA